MLKSITEKIDKGEGTLGQLVNDKATYHDASVAMANLKEVSQRLVDGKGTLGMLLSEDDELYSNAKLILRDVRAAVDDYRESSPILTFTTVLFGAF